MGADACAEGEHTLALLLYVAVDVAYHLRSDEVGAVGGILKDAGEDFFLAGKCGQLYLTVGMVVPARDAVELNLRAKIGFHFGWVSFSVVGMVCLCFSNDKCTTKSVGDGAGLMFFYKNL